MKLNLSFCSCTRAPNIVVVLVVVVVVIVVVVVVIQLARGVQRPWTRSGNGAATLDGPGGVVVVIVVVVLFYAHILMFFGLKCLESCHSEGTVP